MLACAFGGKGDRSTDHASPELDALVRQAFGLIIDIRHHGRAARSLALAVNFLRAMARNPGQDTPPFVFSFTVVPMRENPPDSASKPCPKQEGEERRGPALSEGVGPPGG
jgi:hypothetical protein